MGNSGATNRKRKERGRAIRAKDPRKLFKKTAAYDKGPKKHGPNSPIYGTSTPALDRSGSLSSSLSAPISNYVSKPTAPSTPATSSSYVGKSASNKSSPASSSSTPSLDLLLVEESFKCNRCILVGSKGVETYVRERLLSAYALSEVIIGTRSAVYFTMNLEAPEVPLKIPGELVERTSSPLQTWGFSAEELLRNPQKVSAYVEKRLGAKPAASLNELYLVRNARSDDSAVLLLKVGKPFKPSDLQRFTSVIVETGDLGRYRYAYFRSDVRLDTVATLLGVPVERVVVPTSLQTTSGLPLHLSDVSMPTYAPQLIAALEPLLPK